MALTGPFIYLYLSLFNITLFKIIKLIDLKLKKKRKKIWQK